MDPLTLYGQSFSSRLLLGTARYPSPAILAKAIEASRAEIVTVSLRREAGGARGGETFWELVRASGARVLPNTAGCRTAREAIVTAQMAREVFGADWIKLEVTGDEDLLQPEPFGLVEAARILSGGRFLRLPLYDRGPVGRGQAPRGGLPGADALGRADRLGAGDQQSLRPARVARALSRRRRSSWTRGSARRPMRRRSWSSASTPRC